MSADGRRWLFRLDPRSRHFIELILFEGETCARIARTIERPTSEVRALVISAIREVIADATQEDATVVLSALGALDDVAHPIPTPDLDASRQLQILLEVAVATTASMDPGTPRVLERVWRSLDDEDYN